MDQETNSDLKVGRQLSLHGVHETALYAEDLEAAERFYHKSLGLEKIAAFPGRLLAFRCQNSILLLFNPLETTREQLTVNGGVIPLHGAHGAGHMAFCIAREEISAWRERFQSVGIAIESEVDWPNGAHSIYFRDPAGNSLELATSDMWAALKS
jgi:catechol 2,3-dioxygenase-like lactoylglutathione lyase family enzyme